MEHVRMHLDNILRQRGTVLWGGYVNMVKTLESVFPSAKHWLLEFLQNAEDAGARTFSICLGEDLLIILNDGAPFSLEDFRSICDVKSRKFPSGGFLGYIGIGFKSIFQITDEVEIHSGEYHFKFDKNFWREYCKRENISLSEWPWEILPLEVPPREVPAGYRTGFYVSLAGEKSRKVVDEIKGFLSDAFPKEIILLLRSVGAIEVKTPATSFLITKEVEEPEEFFTLGGEKARKEVARVKKEIAGGQGDEESYYYLVLRKTVTIPDKIRRDEETERVRRSELSEREVGLIFGLDSQRNLCGLSGRVTGVYSFLPVEGEQTGLPFGIFGDFIPQPGRDLINYGTKWNYWMCEEIAKFFMEAVKKVFLSNPAWRFYPADVRNQIGFPRAKGFWEDHLKAPIFRFLQEEALYPDEEGTLRRLNELVFIEDEIVQVLGKELVEKALGNTRLAHRNLRDLISLVRVDAIRFLRDKKLLDLLREEPRKLAGLYRSIAGLSDYMTQKYLPDVPFVLSEDGEFCPPKQVVKLEIDAAEIPEPLRDSILQGKKRLHPEIASDPEAVKQLERCGLQRISTSSVGKEAWRHICSPAEGVPRKQLIEATLFLLADDSWGSYPLERLVAQDGTLHAPQNLFLPGGRLDWLPLWEAGFLSGFQPVHPDYLNRELLQHYSLSEDKVERYLEKLGVHGFDEEKDKQLIETAAYAIARERLREHNLSDVTKRPELGYDFQCQSHCRKVFEIKGMARPRDVVLEESHCRAARERGDDYVLVCVYNLPSHPDKVHYKELSNPAKHWEPVNRARVPKETFVS